MFAARSRHLLLVGFLSLSTNGCWWVRPIEPPEPSPTPTPQGEVARPYTARALPGGLDTKLLFDSNSPEIVQQPGILLATAPAGLNGASVQAQAIEGDFGIFSHHIARDTQAGAHLLYLGLVASNPGARPVVLSVRGGASYLSQPDAPFRPMPTLLDDPTGLSFAGPGDRVATDLVHGRSTFQPLQAVIPAGSAYLVYNLAIPTFMAASPPINGRTTYMSARADGPVGLAEVAVFAERASDGTFIRPDLSDYLGALQKGVLAGPRDLAPTLYDPAKPKPPGPFRYGRVSGVAQGLQWQGELFPSTLDLPGPGETVGFPVDALYLTRLGTEQVQTGKLLTRYYDTAYAAHGNYGVTYNLGLRLINPDDQPRRYALALSEPLRVDGKGVAARAVYSLAPKKQVMFRGPIGLTWTTSAGRHEARYVHIVLRQGEASLPFATIEVPPHDIYQATVTLIYPADATPPQLLTVTRD